MFADPDTQYYTPEEATAKKKAYALELLRDPFHRDKAAMAVESRSTHVSYILTHWQFDNEVNRFMEEAYQERGAKATIPTKDEFAASLIREANECRDKETKLDFLKLFASVMGYVEKPAAVSVTTNNTLNNVKNNVIILPAPAEGITLEAELMEYQRKLTANERG